MLNKLCLLIVKCDDYRSALYSIAFSSTIIISLFFVVFIFVLPIHMDCFIPDGFIDSMIYSATYTKLNYWLNCASFIWCIFLIAMIRRSLSIINEQTKVKVLVATVATYILGIVIISSFQVQPPPLPLCYG